ncbi:MAG: hypothetical protein IKZ54_03020 [Bacteroidales bacterium]|nr:hypothetical protein [Bacteroidales bacterium]
MTNANKDDLFYVCSLVEFIARKTKNKRGVVANKLGVNGFAKQLKDAQVNHCLSFEQVGEEVVDQYKIPQGNFESVENCKYDVPSYTDIGNLYCIMVLDCAKNGDEIETAIKIFTSPISDFISNFNSDCYYQSPSYLEESFKAGKLL